MANKIAFFGTPTNYVFPLAGRRILYAPLNTAIPPTVVPIYDDSIPAGWSDMGPTVNSIVETNVDFTTAEITTGVLASIRRTYIEKQTGTLTARLWRYEPVIASVAMGQTPVVITGSTSLNRGFSDLFIGGQLGDKQAILVFEDFDIPLVEDINAAKQYEQAWLYTPRTQKKGSLNLFDQETKSNVVPLELELLPYTNAAAGGRDILIQVRWLDV